MALVLIAGFIVAQVFLRTRALIPVLSAVLVAILVLWGTSDAGLSWFTDRIGEDAGRYAAMEAMRPASAP
jgi:hypothetical protein